MKKEKEEQKELLKEIMNESEEIYNYDYGWTGIVRVTKEERKRKDTNLIKNKSISGDTIEKMMERIRNEDGGEEAIPDRDIVYNDNEVDTVNPITNIRSDKFELMLEQKNGEYEHKHRKIEMKVVKDEDKDSPTEGSEESVATE